MTLDSNVMELIFDVRSEKPIFSADAQERLAAFADVFSFRNSQSYKFEPVFGSILIANARREMKRLRCERDLEMDGITDFQFGPGCNSSAAFREVDRSPLDVSRGVSLRDSNSDTLMELKPREATLRESRNVFHRGNLSKRDRETDFLYANRSPCRSPGASLLKYMS